MSFRLLLLSLLLAVPAHATEKPDGQPDPVPSVDPKTVQLTPPTLLLPGEDGVEVISILGDPAKRERIAGSAHRIDDDSLERWEYDDVGRLLKQVPGVYVRDEDGYGLRPNIGLRGANSDRSKKIVLMEDGILFAPAPYSAPAAYYFPIMTRATGLEVFKGPAAIRYGPHTIGGAVNVLSRAVPYDTQALIDVSGGQQVFAKAHGALGSSTALGRGRVGFLLEGVHVRSDGFKELDGGGDTGFEKNEAVLKLRWESDPASDVYQWAEVKFTYSDEESDETYLGLTEDDFDTNPRRRYFASQNGLLDWRRGAVQLTHVVEFGDDVEVRTSVYRSDLDRTWGRLASLGGRSLFDVLYGDPNDPGLEILRGERDSAGAEDVLGFTTNDRVYYSQGIQSALVYRPNWLEDIVDQELQLGVRAHRDFVRRFHTGTNLLVRGANLVDDGSDPTITTHNVDRTNALSAFITDEIQWETLTLTPGLRVESIGWERRNRLTRATVTDRYEVVLPGVGAFLGLPAGFGLLAGVHRGFSPVAPGTDDAEPEFSVNYEAGGRWSGRGTSAEIVGFFNDYSNLTNVCSFSGGCREELLDRQSDAGAVDVYGVEASARFERGLGAGVRLNGGASYTFTQSEFQEAFDSADPLFGNVDPGEELPYLPEHQASLDLGAGTERWGLNTVVTFVDRMRETADEDAPFIGDLLTDRQLIVDVGTQYRLTDSGELYGRIENLFNQQNVVARRPFGGRPGRPVSAFIGFKYRWGNS